MVNNMLCGRCHVEIQINEKMDSIKKESIRKRMPEQEFQYARAISD